MNGYEDFVAEMKAAYDEVYEIALEKVEIEHATLLAFDTTLGGLLYHAFNRKQVGTANALRYSETKIDLEEFAKTYCFDYGIIEASIDEIKSAQSILEENDTGTLVRNISEGLYSWDSEKYDTADIFKRNYVDSIWGRYGKQTEALESAQIALEGVIYVVDAYRAAVLDLLSQLKEALNKYDPIYVGAIMVAKISLSAAGIIVPAGPELASASMVADLLLTDELKVLGADGTGAAGMFANLRSTLVALSDQADDAFNGLGSKVDSAREDQVVKDYICSQPSMYDKDGDYVGQYS